MPAADARSLNRTTSGRNSGISEHLVKLAEALSKTLAVMRSATDISPSQSFCAIYQLAGFLGEDPMNPYGEILLKAMVAASVTYFLVRIAVDVAPVAYAVVASGIG